MQPLRDFLSEEFDVNLKVWHNIALEDQDKSVDNIIPIVEQLDPWALNSVFQSAVACKSAALAFALIWRDGSGLVPN
jgi:chaperone required for assembly of F1-ATPase